MAEKILADAGKATAEEGVVFLDGPDGVAISMTPDCAEQTGRELIDAAAQARTQSPDPSRVSF
jgi:N-acetyl-gamma-glutamylphosphate reductase